MAQYGSREYEIQRQLREIELKNAQTASKAQADEATTSYWSPKGIAARKAQKQQEVTDMWNRGYKHEGMGDTRASDVLGGSGSGSSSGSDSGSSSGSSSGFGSSLDYTPAQTDTFSQATGFAKGGPVVKASYKHDHPVFAAFSKSGDGKLLAKRKTR